MSTEIIKVRKFILIAFRMGFMAFRNEKNIFLIIKPLVPMFE